MKDYAIFYVCFHCQCICIEGGQIKFIDIRPDTLNINENLIEEMITKKTKAIVPVYYARVGCKMKFVVANTHKHYLKVIQDAAQGVCATCEGKYLGTIGDLGTIVFMKPKTSFVEGGH